MQNIVVCDKFNLKQAALLFDHALPIFSKTITSNEPASNFLRGEAEFIDALLSDGTYSTTKKPDWPLVERFYKYSIDYISDGEAGFSLENIIPESVKRHYKLLLYHNLLAVTYLLTDGEANADAKDALIEWHSVHADVAFEKACQEFEVPLMVSGGDFRTDKIRDDILVELSNIRLFDVSGIPWEHICEMRSDPDVRLRLRRFRDFFRRDFEHKSLSEIEDALCVSIEDYESLARQQGLKLAGASLSAITDKQGVLSFASAVALAATGGPVGQLSALAVASLGLGGVLVKVASVATDMRSSLRDHKIAYLSELTGKSVQR